MRVTSTRASLKQAPPPRSVSASGTSAFAVEPFSVLFRHSPLGRLTTPGRTPAFTVTGQWTSPPALKTRAVSPVARLRRAASAGCMCSVAGRARSSPSVDVTVLSLAGETRARG